MGSNETSFPCPILFPSKTAKLRDQITRFNQKDEESLYDVWERFKEMLRICPHHGLEKWLIVYTFYNGLSYTTKMTIDAAAGVTPYFYYLFILSSLVFFCHILFE